MLPCFSFLQRSTSILVPIFFAQALSFSLSLSLALQVDAQDEPYQDSLNQLVRTISLAYAVNPSVAFEVFIHKVDGDLFLTDEQKIDCQHEIQTWVLDELHELVRRSSFVCKPLPMMIVMIFEKRVFRALRVL